MGSPSMSSKSSRAKPRVKVTEGNSLSGWLSIIGRRPKTEFNAHKG